jgi:mono/diheme cytochrome c family protein
MVRDRLITAVSAALLACGVAAEDGDPARGARVYEVRCKQCHGANADEGDAGVIRGLPRAIVRDALDGFEAMPKVRLSDADFEALAAHLALK